VLDTEYHESPGPELAQQFEGVPGCPILDDAAVLESAGDDAIG
jgi:hypothetical protein